jgi:hypothetical protein
VGGRPETKTEWKGAIVGGAACHNCTYSCCDPELWLHWLWRGEPILPRCANHPRWPGQLREVPGVPCRNYRPKPVLPQGDHVRMIPLNDGFYAYVDAADYDWLSQWRWHVRSTGYAGRNENGAVVLMHRQIMHAPKGKVVDHIDGSKANNCRFNLRVCSHRENRRNTRKQNGARSRFKGVTCAKRRGKWYALCWFEGRNHWLGSFATELEAARAYDCKAVECLGEFARLNFPEEWPPERRAQVRAQWGRSRKKENDKGARAKGIRRSRVKHPFEKPAGGLSGGTRP